MRVIGTAGTEEGRALVLEHGADAVFDHRDPARLSAMKTVADGRGPDVILEMLANVNLDADLGLLEPGGRVVVIGNRGRTEIDARQTMGKELSILGMALWNVPADEILRHPRGPRRRARGRLAAAGRRTRVSAGAGRASARAVMEPGAKGKIVLVTCSRPGRVGPGPHTGDPSPSVTAITRSCQ